MKFNFKKISAVAGSLLLTGLTMGTAMAANYPAPFVQNGVANVAVVYGSGTGMLYTDIIQAGNLQTDLQSYMGSSSSGTSTTVDGEAVSLDTSSTRIWLNSSLNVAKTTLTKSDLPTVLADTSFSGNVDATLAHTIKIISGAAAGGEHSGKVWFGRQPSSSDDPQLGISIGASSQPLYNLSVTMKAVNFSHANSLGETLNLFGKEYTVSTSTTDTSLILYSEGAQKTTLSVGGSSPNPAVTVTIDGVQRTIELINGDSSSASISVDGVTGTINNGQSRRINGVEIAITSLISSTATSTLSATLLIGSEKLTLEHGTTVLKGADDDPIEGTKVYLSGTAGALTELAIEVYKPSDPEKDAITSDTPFVDPVFGSFKVDFQGISSPLDDSSRETISISNSGDDKMQISMTDSKSNEKTFTFAYNNSGTFNLSDGTVGQDIKVREVANLSLYDYSMIGIDNYGHLVQVTQITNSTSGSSTYANDKVKLRDVFSGETYEAVIISEGQGTLTIDGKVYTVKYGHGSGEDGWVTIKYPTSDSLATNGMVVYPTIETKNGAKVAFVENIEVDLNNFDGVGNDVTRLYFPDGDGWGSAITISKTRANAGAAYNWTINGVVLENKSNDVVNITVGDVSYFVKRVEGGLTANNKTIIGIKNISKNADLIKPDIAGIGGVGVSPGVLMFEGKDTNNEYKVVYVDLEQGAAGNSNSGVGVNDVYFSSKGSRAYYSATLYSDSDTKKELDYYGTLVTTDSSDSDQKTIAISYPKSQVYANIFVGEESASISTTGGTSGSTQLGDILVTDAEVSSVSNKNLIIVGGSCINSAAATLVGGAACGASFTEATGVGSGQFVIQGYASSSLTSKMALLVAGYEFGDTVNAVTYLRNKKPDTSSKWIGTSSTSATLQTASA